jgi:hypothetical protein
MFLLTQITKWTDSRDSSKRTHKRDIFDLGYRLFLINPNRIVNLKVKGTGSSFKFSDNHRDRQEATSYIEANSTVAEIIAQHDVAFHSKFITLNFYPKNNPHRTPVAVTTDVEDIAYFDDYNDPAHPGCVWMVYNVKAFKRVEQLVEGTLEGIEDRLETGTSTSSTSTPEEDEQ